MAAKPNNFNLVGWGFGLVCGLVFYLFILPPSCQIPYRTIGPTTFDQVIQADLELVRNIIIIDEEPVSRAAKSGMLTGYAIQLGFMGYYGNYEIQTPDGRAFAGFKSGKIWIR